MFCSQIGYLNSKLMLRWDSPFKQGIQCCKGIALIDMTNKQHITYSYVDVLLNSNTYHTVKAT